MPELWDRFEGFTTAAYVLGRCLNASADTAYFEATVDGERRLARLVSGGGAEAQLELWKRIAGLSHPHLLRLFDTGWLECEGAPVAWALLERPDEILGAVLESRALTAEETGQAVEAAAEALSYVHANGFVYGTLSPWSIVAAGDAIKLPCDELCIAEDGLSPEADVRALGLAACEMLTRRTPEFAGGEPQFSHLTPLAPFETFIRQCLSGDGWTAARAAAYLRNPQPETAPAPAVVEPPPSRQAECLPHHDLPPIAAQGGAGGSACAPKALRVPRWAYGAAFCALAVVLYFAAKSRKDAPLQPAPAAVAVTQRSATPPARPAPAAPPASSLDARVWRVIAYTFNGSGAAEKKAQTINRKYPQFKAEVFAPRRPHGPYLVSLNGIMTREEALRVQRSARSKGLPRDTFVRNY